MAGHRRGTGRPTRDVTRAERRQRLLTDRLGRSRGPAQRLAAAADYARGVLAGLETAAAATVADELCRVLVDTARQAERSNRR